MSIAVRSEHLLFTLPRAVKDQNSSLFMIRAMRALRQSIVTFLFWPHVGQLKEYEIPGSSASSTIYATFSKGECGQRIESSTPSKAAKKKKKDQGKRWGSLLSKALSSKPRSVWPPLL